MKADLHVHSTASDGTLTPHQLVDLAISRGLSVLAIADHDSVEGVTAALDAARHTTLTLVPAVELSAVSGTHDVHILGYWIRHDDAHLAAHLADLRDARRRRAAATVEALRRAGHEVGLNEVLALSEGGSVGRSHIARALVAGGHATDVADAFVRLIGRGKPFYVPKDVRSPQDVISLVRKAGGVAVLAHPGVSQLDDLIPELVEAGLGGIEAYHADHTAEQRDRYAHIAMEAGLLVTGGSDFHGPAAPNAALGSVDLPEDSIAAFLAWGTLPA
jgi:predicted metal-dependent phosphoesterase TrpH